MAESQKIRLFRSSTTYTSFELAKQALDKALVEQGQVAIASYSVGEEKKVVLGIVGTEGKSFFTDTADLENAILSSIRGDVETKGDNLKKLLDLINAEVETRTKADEKLLGSTGDTSEVATIYGAKKGAKEALDAANTKVASVDVETTDKVIAVDNTDGKNPKISIKLNNDGNVKFDRTDTGLKAHVDIYVKGVTDGDKVISLGTDGKLSSTISLSVDATAGTDGKKYIHLNGIGGADLGKIDIADFVKDGMLDSASLATNPEGQPAGTYIVLTWNTDSGKKDPMYINVTSLIDVYTAKKNGGLVLEDHAFSVDTNMIATAKSVAEVASRTLVLEGKVGEAAGEDQMAEPATGLFKGVADNKQAIDKLKSQIETDAVTVKNAQDDKYVKVTKAADSNAYTVASQGIDAAIETATAAVKVSIASAKGAFVTGSMDDAGRKITLSEKIQAVSGATGETRGLAEASDVKTYVDGKVNGKNVDAEGDTGNTALVSASAADNKVTVKSTKKLQDAVTKAEGALQSISGSTAGHITTTTSAKSDGQQTITVSAKTASVSTAAAGADGLATALDVQTYVKGLTGVEHVVTSIQEKHGDFTFAAAGTSNSVNLSVSGDNVISATLTDIDCGTF